MAVVKKAIRYLLYSIIGLLLAAIIVPRTPWYINRQKMQVQNALIEWCKLQPFPSALKETGLNISGGTFSRQFEFSFEIEPIALQQWFTNSEGLKQAIKKNLDNGFTRYNIKPKQATFCEIDINWAAGKVGILAYWS